MAYDASKDQVLNSWENDETGLMISIYQYGDGDPKVQIGPRAFTKKDGSKSTRKAGRLSIDDLLWVDEVMEDIKEKMKGYYLDED